MQLLQNNISRMLFEEEEVNMMAACALFYESAELEKELLLKVSPEFYSSKV